MDAKLQYAGYSVWVIFAIVTFLTLPFPDMPFLFGTLIPWITYLSLWAYGTIQAGKYLANNIQDTNIVVALVAFVVHAMLIFILSSTLSGMVFLAFIPSAWMPTVAFFITIIGSALSTLWFTSHPE